MSVTFAYKMHSRKMTIASHSVLAFLIQDYKKPGRLVKKIIQNRDKITYIHKMPNGLNSNKWACF